MVLDNSTLPNVENPDTTISVDSTYPKVEIPGALRPVLIPAR